MIRRLGNFSVLIGLICLVIFFTSSTFIFEDAWFLLAGLGFTSFGLLLRRAFYSKKDRRSKKKRKRRLDQEIEDE
jgi:uncharacterized membrane protein YbhN (UPF0104 family)